MKTIKPVQFIFACIATSMFVSFAESKPANLLINPGFEELTEKQRPVAWKNSQHAGVRAYSYAIDKEEVFEELQSYRIEQNADQVYGMVKQFVASPDRKSKTFSFTAMLKTKDIDAGTSRDYGAVGFKLVINCIDANRATLKQYKSDPITGSTDWQKVTLEGDIPKGTVKFSIGIMLLSVGVGWVDATYFGVN
jgi:hypothetical protein